MWCGLYESGNCSLYVVLPRIIKSNLLSIRGEFGPTVCKQQRKLGANGVRRRRKTKDIEYAFVWQVHEA
jgi:hypothetical protein